MKIAASGLMILLFAFVAAAQTFEYGKLRELKGLTRVYINTWNYNGSAEVISSEIKKANINNLQILDSPSGAQITLILRATNYIRTVRGKSLDYRSAHAIIIIIDRGGLMRRLIFAAKINAAQTAENSPALKFARKFIEFYRDANKYL